MSNPLAKFIATVEFKAITKNLDASISKLKSDLSGIMGSAKTGNSQYDKVKDQLKTLRLKEKAILQEYQNQLAKNKVVSSQIAQDKKKFDLTNYKKETLLQANKLKFMQEKKKWEFDLTKKESKLLYDKARNEGLNQRSKQRVLEIQAKTALEQAKAVATNARAEVARMRERMGFRSRDAALAGGVSGASSGNVAGAIGAIATGGFAHQAYSVGNFSTSRMPQFEFLTGSAEKAREQIAFVDKEAKRLSIDIVEANGQYKQLLASAGDALGIQKTQDLFSSFSEIATMLGLSGDAQNRGVRAFSQMASKGQIMA